MEKNNHSQKDKIWITATLTILLISFCLLGSLTIYIDPFFHYHAPLAKYEYPITNERYQNNGITRHFEYDSIITGTSMTENFKTSEADTIFKANFIKIPYSGGGYKEIDDSLELAYKYNKNIKYVIRALDYSRLIKDKDHYRTDVEYPTYLYNDNLFDDVNYFLNKTILFDRTMKVLKYTKDGNKTTTFDEYVNWMSEYEFGAKSVLASYSLEDPQPPRELTEEERRMVSENIQQNVTELVSAHPETTFYLFFPPYSICYWDMAKNEGTLDSQIDAEQMVIEELLKYPNVKLYSFCNNAELVCNLEHYRDQAHYDEWVNSQILEWMYNEEYLLTNENYLDYIQTKRDFYNNYDYSALHDK